MEEKPGNNGIKCPYCGNDLSGKEICSRCGKSTDAARKDIEVEYKEFKVSEFLEIRRVQQQLTVEESVDTSFSGSLEQISLSPRLSDEHSVKEIREKTEDENRKKKNKLVLAAAVVIIIIAAVAGAVYLMRILFRP
jgi:hypothetical protein